MTLFAKVLVQISHSNNLNKNQSGELHALVTNS
jgi:hypothetical protein